MTKKRKVPSDNWQLPDNVVSKPLDRAKLRRVAIGENGYRIGEGHHNSTISDEVVNRARDLHEYEGKDYRQIAKATGLNEYTVRALIGYRRRAEVPREWREVTDGE